MIDILLIPLSALFLGMGRGLMTCAIFCAPGMIPIVIEQRANMAQAFRISVLFNIPRVLMLTIAGALFGILVYYIGSISKLETLLGSLHVWAYLLFGIFIMILGIRMFYTARKEAIDEKNGCKSCKSCDTKTPKYKKGNDLLFIFWGSILSFACLAELFLLDGVVITTASSIDMKSQISAGAMGGFTMFMFAIGVSVPVTIMLMISAKAGSYVKTQRVIRTIKIIGGVVLTFIGFQLVWENLFIAIASLS